MQAAFLFDQYVLVCRHPDGMSGVFEYTLCSHETNEMQHMPGCFEDCQ